MKFLMSFIIILCSKNAIAAPSSHVQISESKYGFEKTVDRLKNQIQKMGLNLFTEVDHQAGAKKVKKQLRPTTLLVFGNPKVGTQLMQKNQLVGFDLPMKALVYVDKSGKVKVAVTKIDQVVETHQVLKAEPLVKKVQGALGKLVSVVK